MLSKIRLSKRYSNVTIPVKPMVEGAVVNLEASYGVIPAQDQVDVEQGQVPVEDGVLTANALPPSFQPQLIDKQSIQRINTRARSISEGSINSFTEQEQVIEEPPIGIRKSNEFTLLPQVYQTAYFLTGVKNEVELQNTKVRPSQRNHVYYGRPNLADIFSKITEYCAVNNINRVGVVTCGPTTMTNELFHICRQTHTSSNNTQVQYDIHVEEFDF